MKNKTPYIGVTGFMTTEEVRLVRETFSYRNRPKRLLMVGVLASYYSLRNQELTGRSAKRHPSAKSIHHLFDGQFKGIKNDNILNLVHLSSIRDASPMTVLGDMVHAMCLGGDLCDGLQLNMVWPSVFVLQGFRDTMGDNPRIVLQIGKTAMKIAGGSPGTIGKMVSRYSDLIDDILIDPSGGKGESFKPNFAISVFRELKDRGSSVGLGIAGGLGPDTLHTLDEVLAEFPDVSIDAEGILRNKVDEMDILKAMEYVSAARQMFGV